MDGLPDPATALRAARRERVDDIGGVRGRARRAGAAPSLLALAVMVLPFGPVGPEGAQAQDFPTGDPVIQEIWEEGMENSHVEPLAQTLLDSIGPRLTGSPQLDRAHDWIVERYTEWGITAGNEQYGTWIQWDRGPTHAHLVEPRVQDLTATMLAWSPGTDGPVEGPVVNLPEVDGPEEFQAWLGEVEGQWVLVDPPELTCRPDDDWDEHAPEEVVERLQDRRDEARESWNQRLANAGVNPGQVGILLEQAGAAGVLTSTWAESWGTNRIFSSRTANEAPTLDLSCEDYGLLHRLAANDQGPVMRVHAQADFSDEEVPVYNTVGTIEGTEQPDEYVLLGAHLDTWDGATGATDNGTGTVVMMEAMRILREVFPEPRRSITVGHWGGEEQGLNGSAAFAEDNPDLVDGIQVALNQDNGTGRIQEIGGQGFVHAAEFFSRWLSQVPEELSDRIELHFPGTPDAGRSDHASFVCHQAPSFRLGSHEYDYRDYTWHTNRDTFDKISLDEVRENAVLTAMLAYLAAEDPETMPRDTRVMPGVAEDDGDDGWPECRDPMRSFFGN